MQNVLKVPLSNVLQIKDSTSRKSIFNININSLELNVDKVYQVGLFSGCQARLAEKTELSGHLSPFDIGFRPIRRRSLVDWAKINDTLLGVLVLLAWPQTKELRVRTGLRRSPLSDNRLINIRALSSESFYG